MISTFSLAEASADRPVMEMWASTIDPTANLYAMYQSVEWLRIRESCGSLGLSITVRRDETSGEVLALAATQPIAAKLKMQLSSSIQGGMTINAVELLGGRVLGDCNLELLSEIIASIWKGHPACNAVYIKSLTNNSPLWSTLAENDWRVGSARVYRPYGSRPFHFVDLPGTFEEYLAQFSAKRRYNLKRQAKRMADSFKGGLSVRRVVDPGDIDYLVQCAVEVSVNSWKARGLPRAVPESIGNRPMLARLAEDGLLRSFVLEAEGKPCAFIVGYLFRGVFHYADLAYVEALASHSPGAVLLFLATQELIEIDRARFLNFGITDAQYKQVFGNRHLEDAEVLILKPTLANSLKVGVHACFQDAKILLKKAMNRKPSQSG